MLIHEKCWNTILVSLIFFEIDYFAKVCICRTYWWLASGQSPPEWGRWLKSNRTEAYKKKDCCLVAKSCPTLLRLHGLYPARLLCAWDSSGKNTGVGFHAPLQGIFPTQELNLHLLHCSWVLYHWGTREALKKDYWLVKQKPFTFSHSRCVFSYAIHVATRSHVWGNTHTHAHAHTHTINCSKFRNQVFDESGTEEGVINPVWEESKKTRRGAWDSKRGSSFGIKQMWVQSQLYHVQINLGYFYFCVGLNKYGQFYTILWF